MTKTEKRELRTKLQIIGYLLEHYPLSLILWHKEWIGAILK
jgi:hypothetical protein